MAVTVRTNHNLRFNTTPPGPAFPDSISGRRILDQYGNVYLAKGLSSWGMAMNLSDSDITTALEGAESAGFNAVTVWVGGGWGFWTPKYQHHVTSENFWTGTAWASSFGAAWSHTDWLVEEAERLGITVSMSLAGSLGAGDDWVAVTNTNMYNVGVAIATRYASAPNIMWHVMFDNDYTPAMTIGDRINNYFAGINDTEGASARPVRWCEPQGETTTNSKGWYLTGNAQFSINCWYNSGVNAAEIVEASWADVTGPVGDCEPPYDGAPHYTGDRPQQQRERTWATFIEGGVLMNYGCEDWWPFGQSGLYTESITWQQVPTHVHTVHQTYAWAVIDQYVKDSTWVPSGWVTTGVGSGDTKAACGNSNTAALAYFPSSRTVAVDTTVIAGTANVRLRWYDPTAGTYTSIAASEAQQTGRSVTYPSAHGDGTNDWVLVVDLA